MESLLQHPEFRNNPENFHPCGLYIMYGSCEGSGKTLHMPRLV